MPMFSLCNSISIYFVMGETNHQTLQKVQILGATIHKKVQDELLLKSTVNINAIDT